MKRRSFFRSIAAVVMLHPAFNWYRAFVLEEEETFSFTIQVEAGGTVYYNNIPIKYVPCFAEPIWEL